MLSMLINSLKNYFPEVLTMCIYEILTIIQTLVINSMVGIHVVVF